MKKQRQKLLVSQMLKKQMLLVCMRWQIVLGTVGSKFGGAWGNQLRSSNEEGLQTG